MVSPERAKRAPLPMTSKRWIFFALGLLTLLRSWLTSSIELAPDEAYYYQWSLRPDLCYFSKGPGVAAAIRLGTMLLGTSEAGVRFLSPLWGLASWCISLPGACFPSGLHSGRWWPAT